jgi:hypothetical protein
MRRVNEVFSRLFAPAHRQWWDPSYSGEWEGPTTTEPAAKPEAKPGEELPEPPREPKAKVPKMTKPGVQVLDKATGEEVVQIPGGVDATARYLARQAVRPTRSAGKYESDEYWFVVKGYDSQDMRKIVNSLRGETLGQSLRRRYLPGYTVAPYAEKIHKARGRAPKKLRSALRLQSPQARRKYTMMVQGKLPGRSPKEVKLSPREAIIYLERIGAQRTGPFEFTAGSKTYDLSGFPQEYANKIVRSLVGESLELPEPPQA